MKNTMNIATTLQDCLVQNNRFATLKLTAEQIGAENFKMWTTLVKGLHQAAYEVYAICENSDLTVDSKEVDKSKLYDRLKGILVELGEVNGHPLKANAELATLIVGYAGKRGNADSPTLQFCLSQLRNRKNELAKLEEMNGVRPETIENLNKQIEDLETQKKALLASADNRIKEPTCTSDAAFRLDLEHRLARVIAGQQAKSWEELEAEKNAKKQAQKEAHKKQRQEKRQAEKSAK